MFVISRSTSMKVETLTHIVFMDVPRTSVRGHMTVVFCVAAQKTIVT